MRRMYIPAGLAVVVLVVSLSACSGSNTIPTPTTSQSVMVTQPPSAAATEPGGSSPVPTVTTAPPSTSMLSLFYVAIGDNGTSGPMIGCGDSLVLVPTKADGVTANNQLQLSFEHLLANHDKQIGQSGLDNTLWQSNLQFVSAVKSGDVVTVQLSGTVLSGGVCDDPRIIAQLKQTAMVAVGAGEAEVLVNGMPIEQVLSAK